MTATAKHVSVWATFAPPSYESLLATEQETWLSELLTALKGTTSSSSFQISTLLYRLGVLREFLVLYKNSLTFSSVEFLITYLYNLVFTSNSGHNPPPTNGELDLAAKAKLCALLALILKNIIKQDRINLKLDFIPIYETLHRDHLEQKNIKFETKRKEYLSAIKGLIIFCRKHVWSFETIWTFFFHNQELPKEPPQTTELFIKLGVGDLFLGNNKEKHIDEKNSASEFKLDFSYFWALTNLVDNSSFWDLHVLLILAKIPLRYYAAVIDHTSTSKTRQVIPTLFDLFTKKLGISLGGAQGKIPTIGEIHLNSVLEFIDPAYGKGLLVGQAITKIIYSLASIQPDVVKDAFAAFIQLSEPFFYPSNYGKWNTLQTSFVIYLLRYSKRPQFFNAAGVVLGGPVYEKLGELIRQLTFSKQKQIRAAAVEGMRQYVDVAVSRFGPATATTYLEDTLRTASHILSDLSLGQQTATVIRSTSFLLANSNINEKTHPTVITLLKQVVDSAVPEGIDFANDTDKTVATLNLICTLLVYPELRGCILDKADPFLERYLDLLKVADKPQKGHEKFSGEERLFITVFELFAQHDSIAERWNKKVKSFLMFNYCPNAQEMLGELVHVLAQKPGAAELFVTFFINKLFKKNLKAKSSDNDKDKDKDKDYEPNSVASWKLRSKSEDEKLFWLFLIKRSVEDLSSQPGSKEPILSQLANLFDHFFTTLPPSTDSDTTANNTTNTTTNTNNTNTKGGDNGGTQQVLAKAVGTVLESLLKGLLSFDPVAVNPGSLVSSATSSDVKWHSPSDADVVFVGLQLRKYADLALDSLTTACTRKVESDTYADITKALVLMRPVLAVSSLLLNYNKNQPDTSTSSTTSTTSRSFMNRYAVLTGNEKWSELSPGVLDCRNKLFTGIIGCINWLDAHVKETGTISAHVAAVYTQVTLIVSAFLAGYSRSKGSPSLYAFYKSKFKMSSTTADGTKLTVLPILVVIEKLRLLQTKRIRIAYKGAIVHVQQAQAEELMHKMLDWCFADSSIIRTHAQSVIDTFLKYFSGHQHNNTTPLKNQVLDRLAGYLTSFTASVEAAASSSSSSSSDVESVNTLIDKGKLNGTLYLLSKKSLGKLLTYKAKYTQEMLLAILKLVLATTSPGGNIKVDQIYPDALEKLTFDTLIIALSLNIMFGCNSAVTYGPTHSKTESETDLSSLLKPLLPLTQTRGGSHWKFQIFFGLAVLAGGAAAVNGPLPSKGDEARWFLSLLQSEMVTVRRLGTVGVMLLARNDINIDQHPQIKDNDKDNILQVSYNDGTSMLNYMIDDHDVKAGDEAEAEQKQRWNKSFIGGLSSHSTSSSAQGGNGHFSVANLASALSMNSLESSGIAGLLHQGILGINEGFNRTDLLHVTEENRTYPAPLASLGHFFRTENVYVIEYMLTHTHGHTDPSSDGGWAAAVQTVEQSFYSGKRGTSAEDEKLAVTVAEITAAKIRLACRLPEDIRTPAVLAEVQRAVTCLVSDGKPVPADLLKHFLVGFRHCMVTMAPGLRTAVEDYFCNQLAGHSGDAKTTAVWIKFVSFLVSESTADRQVAQWLQAVYEILFVKKVYSSKVLRDELSSVLFYLLEIPSDAHTGAATQKVIQTLANSLFSADTGLVDWTSDDISNKKDKFSNSEKSEAQKHLREICLSWWSLSLSFGHTLFIQEHYLNVVQFVLAAQRDQDRDLSAMAKRVTALLAQVHLPPHIVGEVVQQIATQADALPWQLRVAICPYLQILVFNHRFRLGEDVRKTLFHLLAEKFLFDDKIEVREISKVSLTSVLIAFTDEQKKGELVQTFLLHLQKQPNKDQVAVRHGAVLGIAACVASSPYTVPAWMPEALIQLVKHEREGEMIGAAVKNTLSEFWRTHLELWDFEHESKFTAEQVRLLRSVGSSSSTYYL